MSSKRDKRHKRYMFKSNSWLTGLPCSSLTLFTTYFLQQKRKHSKLTRGKKSPSCNLVQQEKRNTAWNPLPLLFTLNPFHVNKKPGWRGEVYWSEILCLKGWHGKVNRIGSLLCHWMGDRVVSMAVFPPAQCTSCRSRRIVCENPSLHSCDPL